MGQIRVEKNVGGIEGLCVITPAVHGDARGYFMETYSEREMREAGIDIRFVQDNIQRMSGQPCPLDGGSPEKPVGLAYIGVSYEGRLYAVKSYYRNVSRKWNRHYTLLRMLFEVYRLISPEKPA